MNILYVLSGAEVGTFYRAFFWAKFLTKRGHKVTLICAHPQPSYKLFKVKYRDGIKIINLFRTYHRWDFVGFFVRAVITFFLCIFHRADVVHSFVAWQPPSMTAIFTANVLQRLRFRKWVVLADWDDWWGEGGISDEHGHLLRRGITFLEKKMPKFANGVTVVSTGLMERAVDAGINKDRIYIVPNGADVERIKVMNNIESRAILGFTKNKYILTYMGNSHLPQFFSMMFSAVEKAVEQKIDVILLIAGDIPAEYKANINESIKKRIFFLGRQPQENIPFILGASDILLLPMVNNVEEKSRWPIRFGDYMAAGRPIVSNAVGEIKRIMETHKCGVVSEYNDPEDFLRKILTLLSNETIRHEIGKHAREIAETKYSWGIITKSLEEIYNNANF